MEKLRQICNEWIQPTVRLRYNERCKPADQITVVLLFVLITYALFSGLCSAAADMSTTAPKHEALAALRAFGAQFFAGTSAQTNKGLLLMALVSSFFSAIPLTLALSPLVFGVLPGQKLLLRRKSITFPWQFFKQLNYKFCRPWVDLESVTGVEAKSIEGAVSRLAVLKFRTGGEATLALDCLSEYDLKIFISAVDELAPDCQISSELHGLRGVSSAATTEGRRLTYTRIWEESLAGAARSTVFVPLSCGDKLQSGRVRIVRQLASTPWSATYLARTGERRLVILKESIVPGDSTASQKAAELFDRECKVLSTLNHSRIARVSDNFQEKNRRYLVLEYFPGNDLRELVRRRGAISQDRALAIALQVCEALEYLHGQEPPILHRDLTPDNIVLDEDGSVYLIDFGASKYFFANATGTLVGKQSYIAPEQLRGKPQVQSDIYALGATIYTLLSAKDPLPLNECELKVGRNVTSFELCDLVARMTRFNAADRPRSVTEVRQLLEKIRSDEAAAAMTDIRKRLSQSVQAVGGAVQTISSAKWKGLGGR